MTKYNHTFRGIDGTIDVLSGSEFDDDIATLQSLITNANDWEDKKNDENHRCFSKNSDAECGVQKSFICIHRFEQVLPVESVAQIVSELCDKITNTECE